MMTNDLLNSITEVIPIKRMTSKGMVESGTERIAMATVQIDDDGKHTVRSAPGYTVDPDDLNKLKSYYEEVARARV